MKKSLLFTIIACGISVVLLSCVLMVGLQSEGFGITALLSEEGEESGTKDDKVYSYFWEPENFSGIDITWLNGPVVVKTGGTRVEITESSHRSLKEEEKLQLSSSGGVLKVKWNGSLLPLDIFHRQKKALTVTIPLETARQLEVLRCENVSGDIAVAGFAAEECRFATASGNLDISDISGGSAEFKTVSGRLAFEKIAMEELLQASTTSGILSAQNFSAASSSFSTVSGQAELLGEADELTVSTISADVEAQLRGCPKTAVLESVSGKLVLAVPENEGFLAKHTTVSGDFSSDFPLEDRGDEGERYKTGKAELSFRSTSGQIQLLKSGAESPNGKTATGSTAK